MSSTAERDNAILWEHFGGASLRELGHRFGMSHQGARMVIVREGRRHVDRFELDLLAATKTGEWPTLLVPFQEQDGWQTVLSYFGWLVDELRKRGVPVTVHTTHTEAGTAFQLRQVDQA